MVTRLGAAQDGEKLLDPLEALSVDLYGGRKKVGAIRILAILFVRRGNWEALVLIRLAQLFHQRGHHRLTAWATRSLRRRCGCFVQPTARIGPGLRLPHPNGIVIGRGARVGARCTIYHQVTLGGGRSGDWLANRQPQLGDDVIIYSGAKLIGAIEVGDGAVVGANAVVNRSVPARYAAVGIPARSHPLRSESASD